MRSGRKGSSRPGIVAGGIVDLAAALRFCSRLPIPPLPGEADPHAVPDVRRLARMLPVAGATIGAFGGAVLFIALALGLGPWVSAALAIAALTVVTGAFHEDGLADAADGFGGGATRERRLDIMRDSRIGSFGAAALILAFALRIAALATLAARLDALGAAAAVVHAAALSRTAELIPLALSPSARTDGASASFGRPSPAALARAALIAAAVALLLVLAAALPLTGVALGFGLAAAVAFGMTRLSNRLIGGQTGDVAGAVQQLGEIAALIGLLLALRP
jgi:adenosylcobinamide-GDP ribazoletransferase